MLWVFCYQRLELKAGFKLNLKRDAPVLIAGGVIAFVCLLQILPRFYPRFDLFQRLEWISYDWRVRIAANSLPPCASNLAGVFIDDTALKAFNDGSYGYRFNWPWPRSLHGRLVRELNTQGARAVAFDILFDQAHPPDERTTVNVPGQGVLSSDEFFAREIGRAGNVVLAAEDDGLFPADLFLTNSWNVGIIPARLDADGILRRVKAFAEHRVWHPEIRRRVRALELNLEKAAIETDRLVIPRKNNEPPFEIPLDGEGRLKLDEIDGDHSMPPQPPYTTQRIWHMGIVLAARELKLDLEKALVEPGKIILRGEGGIQRIIPVDDEGSFYIDWTLRWLDPRFRAGNIIPLILQDSAREEGTTIQASKFRGKLVVVGSIGTGNNISDRGATPLEKDTMLVSKHWNVANSVIMNRFIRKSSNATELLLIVLMGAAAAWLTWKLRVLRASFWVVMGLASYTGLAVFLFVQFRYWLPIAMPAVVASMSTHVSLVTYRVRVEQKERNRIKSIFSKVVSPNIVNELLRAENVSALVGARRRVTVYFADIRGFTRVTDEFQVQAEEYVRNHKLPQAVADAYLDEQARDVLAAVNLYLSTIADTIKRHHGTFDKYIGDCVMAFWGAPTPNDRHAVDCVRAAIDAQRAIYELNLRRAAENKRRERENQIRQASGQAQLPMLTLLALGSGINTGFVAVGLMGSDEHGMNYTVFGRDVNLASRLEGVSGRGRIIISDATYRELQRLEPDLAATCVQLPPEPLKGFRDAVQIYEVQWREMDTEAQAFDTGILTGARKTPPTDLILPHQG